MLSLYNNREEGQGLVEYGLILFLVAIANLFSKKIATIYGNPVAPDLSGETPST